MRREFKNKWQQKLIEDPSYREILKEDDLFDGWERNCMPEGTVTWEFELALELLYADPKDSDAVQFLERALAVADRTLAGNKLVSKECIAAFPNNRGQILRTKVYAGALLGKSYDRADLLQASQDLVEGYKELGWDEVSQAYYLGGVRCLKRWLSPFFLSRKSAAGNPGQ